LIRHYLLEHHWIHTTHHRIHHHLLLLLLLMMVSIHTHAPATTPHHPTAMMPATRDRIDLRLYVIKPVAAMPAWLAWLDAIE
jgi:hypothetical protein